MYITTNVLNKALRPLSRTFATALCTKLNVSKRSVKSSKAISRAVDCFLYNAHTSILKSTKGFVITRRKSSYGKDIVINGRKTPTKISYKYTMALIDLLLDGGLIHSHIGGNVIDFYMERGLPQVTRDCSYITLQESFMEIYDALNINDETFTTNSNVITLRDKNKKEQEFTMDPLARETKKLLQNLNKLASSSKIVTNEAFRLDVQLTQILNEQTNRGGRLYMNGINNFQSLSKTERAKVTIDDLPIVTYDYCGFEIALLYSRDGHTLPSSDPYDIIGDMQGYDKELLRSLAKTALIIMLNTNSKKEAFQAVNNYISNTLNVDKLVESGKIPYDFIQVSDMIMHLLVKHQCVSHRFFKGMGGELQFLGSSIASHILEYFFQRGIVCLQCHDSFSVVEEHKELLASVMEKAWELKFGFTDNFAIKEE